MEDCELPVFRSGKGLAPAWCELEYFDIVDLKPGQSHIYDRVGKKEKLIVGKGQCVVSVAGEDTEAEQGRIVDLETASGNFEVKPVAEDTTIIRMCGRWGDEVGGSGLFWVENMDEPKNMGDPVDYPKTTGFDNHYHDCDEYWIVYEGTGVAMSEGKAYEVGPGDCIATGMGHFHDFPRVNETVKSVFFETTMEGEKRPGHLWNSKHGTAVPVAERV